MYSKIYLKNTEKLLHNILKNYAKNTQKFILKNPQELFKKNTQKSSLFKKYTKIIQKIVKNCSKKLKNLF